MANNDFGIIGIDGKAPIYRPDDRWTIWSMDEIYLGGVGLAKYIPKVNDHVCVPAEFRTYLVKSLDPVTMIPVLQEVRPYGTSFTLEENDLIFGTGPGPVSSTFRVYVNNRVMPHTLQVDGRFGVGGSMMSYAKLFRGTVANGNGEVISKVYDSGGHFISENIPLETVQITGGTNYTWKAVKGCHCTVDLQDGELLTLVVYTDQGVVGTRAQLLAENTNFVRPVDQSVKYITSIGLESNFLSQSQTDVIELPLNLTLNSLTMMGVVQYSDGSVLKLPVDGNKFNMLGMDQYVSTMLNQTIPLVLQYNMGNDETTVVNTGYRTRVVSKAYSLITVNPNNSYAVKLYAYPFWSNVSQTYTLRWWLTNLDRSTAYDVTGYVRYNPSETPFDMELFNTPQRRQVNINLRDISGGFRPFVHTQLVGVTLLGRPDQYLSPWRVDLDNDLTSGLYGNGVFARIHNTSYVNLSCNTTSYDSWLNLVYKPTAPLFDPRVETTAPNPSHFIVTYKGNSYTYNMYQWNQDLRIADVVDLKDTVLVKFIKQTTDGDKLLSVAALSIS